MGLSGYYADDYHGPAGDIPVQVFSKEKEKEKEKS